MTRSQLDNGEQVVLPFDRNLSIEECNEYITTLTKLILTNIKTNSPKKRRINNMMCYSNPTIERLYKFKSFLITKIKTTKRNLVNNNNRHLNTVLQNRIHNWKVEIKRTIQLIQQNIKIQIDRYWTDVMKGIKPSSKMWTEIKRFTAKNKNRQVATIKNLEIPTTDIQKYNHFGIDWNILQKNRDNTKYIIFDETQNLNILGQHIEDHTLPNSNLGDRHHEIDTRNIIKSIIDQHKNERTQQKTKTTFSTKSPAYAPQQSDDDKKFFIDTDQLRDILKLVNNKKSFGLDLLPNIIFKHLPDIMIIEICTLFNNLLNNNYFPVAWKIARVLPILKKDKSPTDPESYRPISLLSNFGKLYEILIYEKINNHVRTNKLMPENQFGFRQGHSTTHAITKVLADVTHQLNFNIPTGAVLIDIKKAFESIWLDGLLAKLKTMNFSDDLIKILYDLLYDRTFYTTSGFGNKLSSSQFKIVNGVQQGSITAPILFNLYTADLISNNFLNSKLIQSCAYADDMIVYSSSYRIGDIQKNLQNSLNFIQNYFNLWHIEINPTKCESILFRRPLKNASREMKRNWRHLSIKINNQPIKLCESIKYLGVNIDNLCYMANHTSIQLEKARRAFMGARQLFYNRHLDKRVKIIAYKTLIRPILTYGCQVWYNQVPRYMERYRVFERKCLRHCNGMYRKAQTDYTHYISNRVQYQNYASDRIDVHILNLTRKHIRRACLNTGNSLIFGPYHVDTTLSKVYATSGTVPGPNTFIYFDRLGYIQNRDGLPLIYHVARRPNEKWFNDDKFSNPDVHIRFDTTTYTKDDEYEKRLDAYWWLDGVS